MISQSEILESAPIWRIIEKYEDRNAKKKIKSGTSAGNF